MKKNLFKLGWLGLVTLLLIAGSISARSEQTEAPVLLFDIGMHIEPFGATLSPLVGGSPSSAPPNPQSTDYNNPTFFARQIQDIKSVVAIVEKHGGRLTVQAQTPFTTVSAKTGEKILAELEARGHEIALHFHEEAHLGRNGKNLTVETWCAVFKEEIDYLQRAGAKKPIRYWSGGNLYPGVLNAAHCAGMDVNSDWKNPQTQTTDLKLVGVNPWRPAGGPSETNLSAFAQHDPNGKIIFLPEGNFTRSDFAASRRSQTSGGDAGYFEYLKSEFNNSLKIARADRANVFHFTVHPGEFRGAPNETPFAVIDRWLSEVIDPLVKAGRVRWATFSEMADAFVTWEKANPGVDPRGEKKFLLASSTPVRSQTKAIYQASTSPKGYITFAVNVHDFRHPTESAETLLKLISIFEKYKVKGDFYLTGPMAELYAKERPDLIARLRESQMTISYHVRPPHPLYPGFDQRLRSLSETQLNQVLREYETYKLDLTTGNLLKDQLGGYTNVSKLLGKNPTVVSPVTNDPRIRSVSQKLFAELGAKMTLTYHEMGTDLERPFEYRDRLLVRPSDFSITRWALPGKPEAFWWNMLESPVASEYHPTTYLQKQLANWKGSRAPFITVLIHEDNFFRRGATPWNSIYYDANNRPLAPPYDLSAPDPSQPRTSTNQQAIWDAYEALVAYAAANLKVITSEEIVALAKSSQN
jgi:hypothetical protein